MLLEFRCSNYRSIKDTVTFSMIAGSDDSHHQSLRHSLGLKILPSAVIYGANGSGKSNFLKALSYMANLARTSILNQPGQKIAYDPHKLCMGKPTSMSIQFIRQGVRYAYGFSILDGFVEDEYLYFFPKGRQTRIFERSGLSVIAGSRFQSALKLGLEALKDNRLFLSCAANFTKVIELESVFLFFAQDLVFFDPLFNNWREYSAFAMHDDPEMKRLFLLLMDCFGTGVKDVEVRIEKKPVSEISSSMPPHMSPFLKDGEANLIEAMLVYDQFSVNIMEESAGTRRLFEVLCPLIDILRNDRILVCDELEASLHEALVHQIVELFSTQTDDHSAQLLFTTHDTNLLDGNLMRRDQIWFTQLDHERSSDLYSLSEVRAVRKSENLAKGYMSGKYGAMPMLNGTILSQICAGQESGDK